MSVCVPSRGRASAPGVGGGGGRRAFTLVELMVVISIIAILMGLLMPALGAGRDSARATRCLANLSSLGRGMGMYHNDFKEYFIPGYRANWPVAGRTTYFWGSIKPGGSVERSASGFMTYLSETSEAFTCPMQPWGSYIPQAGANETTTNFGYNGWCLDPPWWNRKDSGGNPMPRKRLADVTRPDQLFVFADSAMFWKPAGIPVLQNSTSLDPVSFNGTANTTPTTHFRHHGRANALTADAAARAYDTEGVAMFNPEKNTGFVGADNKPHYDQ
ncbi:MAG: prepilin-type N-terminal cleavage/methylation domain-containing protein [Planctomycetes bacterium]|nr:prepilin-type N-terminal cleavage/methylation domain-containing protein [Planctomycetota bacterium]